MKKIANACLILLSVSILQGCNPERKGELCIGTREGDLACNNPNLRKERYFRNMTKGDIVTNPDDYAKARKWCLQQYQKRKSCERR
jgi:hypothetical protein